MPRFANANVDKGSETQPIHTPKPASPLKCNTLECDKVVLEEEVRHYRGASQQLSVEKEQLQRAVQQLERLTANACGKRKSC